MKVLIITGTHKACYDAQKKIEKVRADIAKKFGEEFEIKWEPTTWAYMNMIDGWTEKECDEMLYIIDEADWKKNNEIKFKLHKEKIMSRFDYVKYNETATTLQSHFKKSFETLESDVGALEDGRAKSLIMTKLEEAYMWVGKAIRDQQIKNCGDNAPQEERSNS